MDMKTGDFLKEYKVLFAEHGNVLTTAELYRKSDKTKFLLIADRDTMIMKTEDGSSRMYHRHFSEEYLRLIPRKALDMVWSDDRYGTDRDMTGDGSENILVREEKNGEFSYRKGNIGEVKGLKEAMKVFANDDNQEYFTRLQSVRSR